MDQRSPRSRRHERIVLAAARLFADKGYDTVSFEQIAREADVARRTIYNHFHDKNELYLSLIERILSDALRMTEEIPPGEEDTQQKALLLLWELYRTYGISLHIMGHSQWQENRELEQMHQRLLKGFTALFDQSPSDLLDRRQKARLIFRTFLTIIETLEETESPEAFLKVADGLIGQSAQSTLKGPPPAALGS